MIPGRRGFYEGTDKEGRVWRVPRHCNPAIDGLDLLKTRRKMFDVAFPPDSILPAEFDKLLESTIPADVLTRIEHVIIAGTALAVRGLADAPPLETKEWRRGMMLSWLHARDLEIIHEALGHPRLLANRHDLDELVLGSRLKASVNGADDWYRAYVDTLDEGAWVNIGFFNPHLSASLYKWGDAKQGVQNGMNAHRLAAHHQGSPEAPLDWVERAVNFVVHHIPREHMGIRHEPRGGFDDLEARLADDPAIKDASIGKEIARDATRLYELAELEGLVVPWGLLKVPEEEEITPSLAEHAFRIAQLSPGSDDEVSETRIARARSVMARLPEAVIRARGCGFYELAAAYEGMMIEHG